ncbi:MAG TPA: baseplate J/gp47 family protein [Ktedonobacteraceae bacterium]|nr:baseplate J/gp47 family protein [Ktedonobacteraceae bacterium]
MVNEEQMQTVHLYIVPEDQLPPRPDYVGILIATLCSLILLGFIGLILLSPKSEPTVSFQTTITGFRLPSVSKTATATVPATGKGHLNATYAVGTITFYNGAIYTQIIPIDTVLKGADGIVIITDAQAVIPPAAQTTPPTYGQVSIPAHAMVAGASGNIRAGDINTACCATSVIAQNPYNFTGGIDARDFTYLTRQNVNKVLASLAPPLRTQTIALFRSAIVLNPTCSTTDKPSPEIGQETKIAVLTVTVTCSAISFNLIAAKKQILGAGKQFGRLTSVQFSIVGITSRKGVITLRLYVTAIVKPILRLRFVNTGK